MCDATTTLECEAVEARRCALGDAKLKLKATIVGQRHTVDSLRGGEVIANTLKIYCIDTATNKSATDSSGNTLVGATRNKCYGQCYGHKKESLHILLQLFTVVVVVVALLAVELTTIAVVVASLVVATLLVTLLRTAVVVVTHRLEHCSIEANFAIRHNTHITNNRAVVGESACNTSVIEFA